MYDDMYMDWDMDNMGMDNMTWENMTWANMTWENMTWENMTWANMTEDNFTQHHGQDHEPHSCLPNEWCEEGCPQDYWDMGLEACWARVKRDENGVIAGCKGYYSFDPDFDRNSMDANLCWCENFMDNGDKTSTCDYHIAQHQAAMEMMTMEEDMTTMGEDMTTMH